MIEFMNFDTTMFPNFGSGWISRFSALWRRDIGRSLVFSFVVPNFEIPGSRYARPGMTLAARGSLRPLRSVFRASLLAVLDALRVEDTAQDVVAHAGQVLHATATDHHHRMPLQIVALARD